MKRWDVITYYITERDPERMAIDELEELQELIEVGPDWNEIASITIHLNPSMRTWSEVEELETELAVMKRRCVGGC